MFGVRSRRFVAGVAIVAAAGGTATMAGATSHTFDESGLSGGDASGDVSSPTDIGGAVTVTAAMQSALDVDAFTVCLGSDPLVAEAGSSQYDLDLSLYLFDAAGVGLLHNEDRVDGDIGPRLDEAAAGTDFTSGPYVVAVTQYGVHPVDAGGSRIFADTGTYTTQQGPVAPGMVVAGWPGQAFSTGGAYTMTLQGTVPCTTTPPPPADTDGDGVSDDDDVCAGSATTDLAAGLKNHRYETRDGVFVTADGVAGATMADTAGCSFSQVIDAMGLPESHKRNGISGRNLDEWIATVQASA